MDTLNLVIDTVKNLKQPLSQVSQNEYQWLEIILKNNPGLFTILITGLLLPIGLVIINNRSNRKLKETEKELEIKYNDKKDIRQHEKIVYSSLSKVLFDVQQLHVSLSGSCVDENCITKSLSKFDSTIEKYHEEISNNMLFLSSEVIDLIYKFYKEISELKIELSELNNNKKFDVAHVAVYYKATTLAEIIILIQEKFLSDKTDLKIEFDKSKQDSMKNCCGRPPSKKQSEEYKKNKATLLDKESNEKMPNS
jgi:septal ring factor EnvC (AmiA/AmiB activator)